MSWDFDDGANEDHVGRCPQTASHADFSFWAWFYVAASKADANDSAIFFENNNRIVIELDNAAGHDNIDITRSGTSGLVSIDLSAQGFDETDWLFFGIAFTNDDTVARVVLGDETTEAAEITPDTNTISGNAFNASNYKYVGNAAGAWGSSDKDYLHGSVHSFGFHDDPLTEAEFIDAYNDFDLAAHADYTFLLDAASDRTAQSGSGTCEHQNATLDTSAPNLSSDMTATMTAAGLATASAADSTVAAGATLENASAGLVTADAGQASLTAGAILAGASAGLATAGAGQSSLSAAATLSAASSALVTASAGQADVVAGVLVGMAAAALATASAAESAAEGDPVLAEGYDYRWLFRRRRRK